MNKNMNKNSISKDDFIKAYNNHLPNAFTRFAFRYFSQETKKSDKWLKNIYVGLLSIVFLAGFIGTILNWDQSFIGKMAIGFLFLISVVVIPLFVALFMNNYRIKKIMKELGGISKSDYNYLSEKYLF